MQLQPRKRAVILGVIVILLGGIFVLNQVLFPFLSRRLDSKRVPCDQLPSLSRAQQIFNEHNDTVEQIENINPGFVFISLSERCPEKGEVEIFYDSWRTRDQIKKLLGASFFGIPYVMFNI